MKAFVLPLSLSVLATATCLGRELESGRLSPVARRTLLSPGEPVVRQEAATAADQAQPATSVAVAALTKALRDEDARVRLAAAKAFRRIGPAAKAAIPGLVELARDNDAFVRGTAADVLLGMGPAAVPGFAELLLDGNADVRRNASQALRFLDLKAGTEDSPSQTEINR